MFNWNLIVGNLSWNKEEFFRHAQSFFETLIKIFPTFWNYTLFIVDKNPITVGSFLSGIFFIIVGYVSIRIFVSQVDKKILSRFDVDVPHRYTIKILLFYFLVFLLFLFILYLIKVPLTVFTVVGGVVALGIGFGIKNIMNNWVCGILIVTEHPIKVGDLIEVQNWIGIVEHIGFRATSVRSLDNTHILIPNNVILEHSILNWTLSDKVIRSEFKVGVQYGSPVEKVKEILLQVANEHKKVLNYDKDQTPRVFFEDFGDSALIFRLSYWIAVQTPLDIKQVASDLRFEINRYFQEEGITIPFHQSDVHIKEPLQLHWNAQTVPISKEQGNKT